MSQTTYNYREILADKEHPFHEAAWIIFQRDTFNVPYAAKKLGAQRETFLPFLQAIMDDPTLLEPSSLAGGTAPINTLYIFARWEVKDEVLQRLLAWLPITVQQANLEMESRLWTIAGQLLPDYLPQLTEFVESQEQRFDLPFAQMLELFGEGNAGLDWAKKHLEAAPRMDEETVLFYADLLLQLNPALAIEYLEGLLKKKRYPAFISDEILVMIAEYLNVEDEEETF